MHFSKNKPMVFVLAESNTTTMNTYPENISTTTLENSRNSLRRIARHDEAEFSNQSILNVMEKFVKTVNTMDETILVPCRLMDLKVGDEQDPAAVHHNQKSHKNANQKQTVQELLNAADLFQIYNMLNNVKDGLLWGGQNASNEEPSKTTTTTETKGHVRRPSTVSVASTNSSASTISDTESEAGSTNETDSGIEEPSQDVNDGPAQRVAQEFRTHLDGLTRSLRQMTEAAHYLTWRYQHDIGGPV